MLVLKRVKGWSFEETEREVRSSLVYRYLGAPGEAWERRME